MKETRGERERYRGVDWENKQIQKVLPNNQITPPLICYVSGRTRRTRQQTYVERVSTRTNSQNLENRVETRQQWDSNTGHTHSSCLTGPEIPHVVITGSLYSESVITSVNVHLYNAYLAVVQ